MKKNKKPAAAILLIVLAIQTFYPGVAYALTSGPAQPEMAAFKAAGMPEMVDPFSGDLKYNIPLLDVGGYPVNISYASGTTMEDEASWVGEGWSLNPGAMNRTLRGLPDDFNGKKKYADDEVDQVEKTYYRKEFRKVGGTLTLKPSIFAWEFGSASMKFNIYKDNYFGIGASVGASVSFSLGKNSATPLTVGVGIDSDVRDGVNISPNVGVSASMGEGGENGSVGLSASLTYNTRAGLKSTSLGLSYNPTSDPNTSYELSGVKYFGQTHNPRITNNTTNSGFTFSLDLGPSLFGGYIGIGGTGFVYKETVLDNFQKVPAYGYMNYLDGRKDNSSLIDYNREKDGVFITSAPSIPVPVCTNDFFNATAQTGSQQFRPHFASNYVIFDKQYSNKTNNFNGGVTIGSPWLFKGGARIDWSNGEARTNKWTSGNDFLGIAEQEFGNEYEEPVYFKQVGEKTTWNSDYNVDALFGSQTLSVPINSSHSAAAFRTRENGIVTPGAAMAQYARERKNYTFSYLDAKQADKYALDKKIKSYSSTGFTLEIDRVNNPVRKAHHMSEVTVTDNEGKRMVYGIPVYNTEQSEINFAVSHPASTIKNVRRTGLTNYGSNDVSSNNHNGRDWLYSREKTPSYVTGFLLSGILSPDYVDLKKDGITDDDLGTAVKFNYTKAPLLYNWRAPFQANKANFNENLMSDPKDDKANIVFGKKDIWNLYSIESKTMIAIFQTSNREDALGVIDETGGANTATNARLKKLDKIKLYSKAEWYKNPSTAVPIKTVNFEYDYSLYPNIINNTGNTSVPGNTAKGKLTLKKIYFTFGSSSRGQTNPYEFEYNTNSYLTGTTTIGAPTSSGLEPSFGVEALEQYATKQGDRWSSYKPSWYNPSHLENGEYPYALQKNLVPSGTSYTSLDWGKLIDNLVSKWQLSKITTPTGSTVEVTYESDDYAYVQNRKAMQMFPVADAYNGNQPAGGLIGADRLKINLPAATTLAEFKNTYLKDMDKIFYKMFVDLDNSGHYEYVNGYAEIDFPNTILLNPTTALIGLKQLDGRNPIARAGWQKIKADLPQYCYDNYDNSDVSSDFEAAIRSIIQSIGNLREILQPFEKTAKNKNFSDHFDPTKSFVRLGNFSGSKNGGGSRVSFLKMSDQWHEMVSEGTTSAYSQKYEYKTTDRDGRPISSGVASYEPQIGNEENPFHEPVNFTEKIHWSADKYHFIEKPFCESYFPAASVGYSKVTVTSIGNDNINETGYIVNEFYTARDFPTLVDNMVKDQVNYENSLLIRLFSSNAVNRLVNSQGFKIELNDMHGKQKAVRVFGKGGAAISATEYFYSVKDEDAELKELNNDVPAAFDYNQVTTNNVYTATLATDMDVVTDVRESYNDNTGTSVGGYFGSTCYAWFCFPYFAIIPNVTQMSDTYRSISFVKVINRYGILKKVRTMQNGSTSTAENLVYDAMTGEVLLTKNENLYNDNTYTYNYPAYTVKDYDGMGAAFRNLGMVFQDFHTNSSGVISTGSVQNWTYLLVPGDVLGSLNGDQLGWVMRSSDNSLRLIDEDGNYIANASGVYMILRSGRRNMLTASAGSVVTMENPLVSTGVGSWEIRLGVDRKILDAKAVQYNEKWSVPMHSTEEVLSDPQCISINAVHDDPSDKTQYSLTSYYRPECPYTFDQVPYSCDLPMFTSYYSRQDWHPGTCVNSPGTYTRMVDLKTRSFLNFGEVFPVSSNVTILSAKISLYTSRGGGPLHSGNNSSYLERITQQKSCNTSTFTWSLQPAFTTLHRLYLPTSSTATQDYVNYDITSMFNDWFNTRDISDFRMRLRQDVESYYFPPGSTTTFDMAMNFVGPDFTSPTDAAYQPKLTICYTTTTPVCASPVDKVVNPYYRDILGNWRPQTNFVYTVPRTQTAPTSTPAPTNSQPYLTDIRRKGYYSDYTPFWDFNSSTFELEGAFNPFPTTPYATTDAKSRWVWSNKSIHYDQKGNEVESVDALNRYSADLFGYRESVVTATAVNSRHNEIMFDGFEDYDFDLQADYGPCPIRQFDWGLEHINNNWSNHWAEISGVMSHSGKNSLHLKGNFTLVRNQGSDHPTPTSGILGYDGSGRHKLLANELADGFAPVNGKKYLLSFWVHDETNTYVNDLANLGIEINGLTPPSTSTTDIPFVEGWKKVEVPFIGATGMTMNLYPTGNEVYIDDIRITPYDGQMNSYVYDNTTLRLMAQLDENNFATFYEYDEEGTAIRVKKETEKGIMTLKENRQSFRKR